MILHTQPDIGDFVLYLQNGRPASELLSAVWNIYYFKFRRRLPISVTTNMTFSRAGNGKAECSLYSDPGHTKVSKKSAFTKMRGGGNRVSIVWPEDTETTAPRSYL